MEPESEGVPTGVGSTIGDKSNAVSLRSIAISLKRIADSLERVEVTGNPEITPEEEKTRRMDREVPGWRVKRFENGRPMFSENGTMLDDQGNRSIFDDIDE